jgi:NCAIR mutase (PurE)-related protein
MTKPTNLDIGTVLNKVAAGDLAPDAALEQLGSMPEVSLGFANVDLERLERQGLPEVVFAPGKTSEQIIKIIQTLNASGQGAFVTRVAEDQATAVLQALPDAVHHATARAITRDIETPPPGTGRVAVVCAGTSDIPVAEEAALTARRMGADVETIFDVGVSGLHRLLTRLDKLRSARVIVVVAGMEGALPSVVGGLVDRPIIAVPTSIGYGANFEGVAALLTMMNSCAAGVSVVNIDNGFGAGVSAGLINRLEA